MTGPASQQRNGGSAPGRHPWGGPPGRRPRWFRVNPAGSRGLELGPLVGGEVAGYVGGRGQRPEAAGAVPCVGGAARCRRGSRWPARSGVSSSASHLVAARTGYPGCPELGAIPSMLLRRDVRVGCVPWRILDRRLRLVTVRRRDIERVLNGETSADDFIPHQHRSWYRTNASRPGRVMRTPNRRRRTACGRCSTFTGEQGLPSGGPSRSAFCC